VDYQDVPAMLAYLEYLVNLEEKESQGNQDQ